MTQEEKAKAYDKAIKVAQRFYDNSVAITKKGLEDIFPELKESEDERIRENIIATIHLYYGEPLEDEAKEMIAWVEKQGEHANFRNKIQIGDKVTRNEDGVLVNLSQLQRVAKPAENTDKQGEQKPTEKFPKYKKGDILTDGKNKYEVLSWDYTEAGIAAYYMKGAGCKFSWKCEEADKELYIVEQNPTDKVEPKFKVGQIIKKEGFNLGFTIVKIEDGFYYNNEGDYFPFTDQDNWELVEQKPAWSEEDELHIRELESLVKQVWAIAEHKNDKEAIHKMSDLSFFLKTLKPQLKQEWSEEDREMIDLLIAIFRVSYPDEVYKANPIDTIDMKSVSSSEIIDWLKSLKDRVQPQKQWKPSDEQMGVLANACDGKILNLDYLNSLYQDLQKLRKE